MKFKHRMPETGNWIVLLMVVTAVMLITPAAAFAQGSIFGTVQNSTLTTPADGEISFVGFLDDTDEEIRIELSDGAGYQAGNWFDDFQNYLTEAAGNPYDYYFVNLSNGQSFHLANSIPNNSFQQENIVLAPSSLPAQPVGLTARAISSSKMFVSWSGSVGSTYHVYRRLSTSNGSFLRVDNPAGSLANAGVSDTFFVDTTVDGVSSYTYVVIAENGGLYSAHSALATGVSSALTAPVLASIAPATGPSVGGTPVVILGAGFDNAGVTVLIDGNLATSVTVVNAGRITATTPNGAGPADVIVTNNSAALADTLVNGFNYYANTAPVANAGPDQLGQFKNTLITLTGAASSDSDLDSLTYSWLQTSGPAVVLSSVSAVQPTFTATANGDYFFRLIVNDGVTNSTPDTVRVQIVERAPVLAAIGPRNVVEGANLNFVATASDADATTPVLSAVGLPLNATFVNNGNGTGTFNFNPTFVQAGVYNVTFIASDGVLADSEVVAVTVNEAGNQRPVLAAIGPRNVNEGLVLNFNTSATDPDGTLPTFAAANVPANATYTNNGNGTATFVFSPNFAQAGVYNVTFIATDGTLADSEVVAITVNEGGNQRPVLAAIGPKLVTEGANLNFVAAATDADSTVPTLSAVNLPLNSTFVNNGNGTGTFSFNPSFTQSGVYNVTFIASDGSLADSEVVAITVNDAGNQAPVLAAIGPRNVVEGANLNFLTTGSDLDGTIPTLSAANLPVNATFVNNGNGTGTFNFNPSFVQAGVYNVTFIASDGVLADSEVVAVTVNEAGNQRPVLAAIGPRNVNEGAVLNFNTTATDPDGTLPTFTAANVPVNATYVDNGNGTATFVFSPNFAQAGVYNVTFIATDGTLADSEVVAITVNEGGNQAPILAAIGPKLVTEGANLNFVATATDADASVPTLSAVNIPLNATFLDNGNGTGTFNFNPSFTQSGVYNVTIIASDGTLADSEVVAITVNDAGNQAPVLAAIGPQPVNEGANLNFVISALDADGTTPGLSAIGLPAGATFINNGNGTGTFDFTPNFAQSGIYNVTFIASDGVLADSEVVAISVNEAGNQAPVLAAIGPRNVDEGVVLNFNISASDPDAAIPTLTAVGVPANATFLDNADGTGTFNFAPDFTQAGIFNVTFIASDGFLADSEVVVITVNEINRPPVLAAIGPQLVAEGILLSFGASATDLDATIPTLTAINLPLNATFVDNADGTGSFDFTPSFSQSGVYNVTFIASDGVLADSEIVAITVNDAGNQSPVLAAIGNRSVQEGNILAFRLSAIDTDGTIPTLAAFTVPANAVFVDSANGAGSFTFSPNFNQAGIYNVLFVASDGALADSESIQITVGEAGNLPPVLDSIGAKQIAEGNILSFRVHATDEAGIPDLLVNTLMNNYVFVDSGNGAGSFTYSPNFFDAGVDTVTFFTLDGDGAVDQEKVAITTLDINRPPKVSPIADVTAIPGDSVKIRIVATDSTDANGGRLYLLALAKPSAAVFVDSTNNRGSLRWLPTAADTGVHQFIVLCTDDESPALSSRDTAIITILVTNQAPVLAAIGSKSVAEGQTLTFRVSATDPDGTIPFFFGQTIPPNAILIDSANGAGSFSFTPSFSQAGLFSVKIFASDGNKSDNETVLIQVTNVPQPPIISVPADTQFVTEGQILDFLVSATDPDGTIPQLKIDSLLTPPLNSVFTDSANGRGSFHFAPVYVQAGLYDLTFIATDGQRSDTGLVVVNVLDAGNQAPSLTVRRVNTIINDLDTVSINDGDSLRLNLATSDPDSITASISSSSSLPPGATLTDNGDGTGSLFFQSDIFSTGIHSITFLAVDGADNQIIDSSRVVIRVNDVNTIPNPISYDPFNDCLNPANCGTETISEGATFTVRFYSHDNDLTDPIMTARPYTVSGTDTTILFAQVLPANMTVNDFGDTAIFTFSPNFQQAGQYRIAMLVIDQNYSNVYRYSPWVFSVTNVSVPPVLNPIGPLSVLEGQTLDVNITGSDPDGLPVTVSAAGLPSGATFTALTGQPAGTGTSRLLYTPGFSAAGVYNLVFRVKENATTLIDTELVTLTVIEAGPQSPVFADLSPAYTVNSNSDVLRLYLRATDVDSPPPTLSFSGQPIAPWNAVFVDSGNGRGSYVFDPIPNQVDSTYNIRFIAVTPGDLRADTMFVSISVIEGVCGDADGNLIVSISDGVYLINYIFASGPAPITPRGGDPDCNGLTSISDAVYLINYIFASGPAPCFSCP
ncbi:MAG: Ig-like domain-containing protein [Candidatus Zixiibacteriota bacterium]